MGAETGRYAQCKAEIVYLSLQKNVLTVWLCMQELGAWRTPAVSVAVFDNLKLEACGGLGDGPRRLLSTEPALRDLLKLPQGKDVSS